MKVTKRSGSVEAYNLDKIHRILSWATDGLDSVSVSDIEMNAKLNLESSTTTEKIHKSLIRAANNLISLENSNYQFVAARLLSYWLRKSVWGESEPPRLYDLIVKNVDVGVYDKYILNEYTEAEIHKIGKFIKHERDELFTYAGLQQVVDKYLIKNRENGKIYETPQFVYILIAMFLFAKYPKETRIDYVKKLYNYFSTFKINIPTPIISGCRSNIRQFASCALFDCDDSLDSIFANVNAVGFYSAKRAGIGLNLGKIRPINSHIRLGEVVHTGVLPFAKVFESTVKSTSQNGIRGASANCNICFWHYEIMDIIPLKNNSGTDDNRIRKMDYTVQFGQIFYDRLIKNEDITLFSPHECPELRDSFGMPDFTEKYLAREKDTHLKFRKKIKAKDLMELLSKERYETGRIYIMNMENCNQHNPFVDRVTMTNLCVSKDTLLLTDCGHKNISSLYGQEISVWNGKQFSKTTAVKTGENQKLFRVELSDGGYLDCTDYHKWYTIKDYNSERRNKHTEKRTFELVVGDKLIKFSTPIIESTKRFKYPYTHGFFCADGTYENQLENKARISLYGEKANLIEYFEVKNNRGTDSSGRLNITIPDDIDIKFAVPMDCCIEDKLSWLSGYLDGDGCVCLCDGNYSMQFVSINLEFLRQVKLMLQTLGVQCKICKGAEAGFRLMPDGKGGSKEYFCQKNHRIVITSNGLYKLNKLGLNCHRLKYENLEPQRDAAKFVTVVRVSELDGLHDTYCVNEPYEHKAVFNGILTGNCVEVTHPTKPIQHIDDENAEIGVCILSAVNVVDTKKSEIPDVCEMIVRMLDELIDYQSYPVKAAENFTKNRRSIGVGMTNLASLFAQNKLEYGSLESLQLAHTYMESIQYYLLKASSDLAKEKGPCAKYDGTKYSEGWLPIDTYNKSIDKLGEFKNVLDWESLRATIKETGLRHSTLTCQMPVESSSVVSNSTNGIEPVRNVVSYKKSKTGTLKQIVPLVKMAKYYTSAWDIKSNQTMNNMSAVIQKFMDMSISTNHYYNPAHYEGGNVPYSVIIKDILHANKMGLKTLYYANTNNNSDESVATGCESGSCTI